jgi:protein-disulfide isomerase
VVKAIQNQLGDQLRFVFRNFPLIEIHPHALNAALAAEAAAAQGKFWEMHDYIFHHQHTLEDADLTRFAEAVGLDMEQYAHDMMQQSYLPRIEEDVESGERSGVQGTPTFFINGILYRGSWEQHTLLTALEAASQGSGVSSNGAERQPGGELYEAHQQYTAKGTSRALASVPL